MLKTDLDAFRAEILAKLPAEIAAKMQQAAEQLAEDFLARPSLRVGDHAPDFALPNMDGKMVRLSDRLRQGAVILTFYRGGWCPYCNLELRAYQKLFPQIQAAGASILAISPQSVAASEQTAERDSLGFEVLSDAGAMVAQAYHLAFDLPDELKQLYAQFGHALPDINAAADWRLPVPATFVIDQSGKVCLAHVDVDYRNRLEPSKAIQVLQAVRNDDRGLTSLLT